MSAAGGHLQSIAGVRGDGQETAGRVRLSRRKASRDAPLSPWTAIRAGDIVRRGDKVQRAIHRHAIPIEGLA